MQAKNTLWIAIVLTLFGIVMFVATGAASPTALIPSLIGVLLLVAESLARQKHLHKRAIYAATLISLVGLLSTVVSLATYSDVVGFVGIASKIIMAALCGLALVLYLQAYLRLRQTPVQPA